MSKLQSGVDGGTVDLLLYNFDIDGSYLKVQHEAALDNLVAVVQEHVGHHPLPDPQAVAYTLQLQGYADRTGSAAYNEVLANDREAAVEAYLRAKLGPTP